MAILVKEKQHKPLVISMQHKLDLNILMILHLIIRAYLNISIRGQRKKTNINHVIYITTRIHLLTHITQIKEVTVRTNMCNLSKVNGNTADCHNMAYLMAMTEASLPLACYNDLNA